MKKRDDPSPSPVRMHPARERSVQARKRVPTGTRPLTPLRLQNRKQSVLGVEATPLCGICGSPVSEQGHSADRCPLEFQLLLMASVWSRAPRGPQARALVWGRMPSIRGTCIHSGWGRAGPGLCHPCPWECLENKDFVSIFRCQILRLQYAGSSRKAYPNAT